MSKTMLCRDLGGPAGCNQEFHAATFEEAAKQSKNHGSEMFNKKDPAHLEAQKKMMEFMKNPNPMQKWMEEKRKEFEALPES